LEHLRRQHRVAALAPLAALDAQQHALGIDVADLERDNFRDATCEQAEWRRFAMGKSFLWPMHDAWSPTHRHKDGFQPVPQFQISMDARGTRLSLPRKLKGPIMASTPSGIWGTLDSFTADLIRLERVQEELREKLGAEPEEIIEKVLAGEQLDEFDLGACHDTLVDLVMNESE
jgi:hypothetical protein